MLPLNDIAGYLVWILSIEALLLTNLLPSWFNSRVVK